MTHCLAQQLGVHQPDAETAAGRWIGASPCITYGSEPRHNRRAVDDEPAIAVQAARHREDPRDRLAIEPVRLHRACPHHPDVAVGITKLLQRCVTACGENSHRPGVVVPHQGQYVIVPIGMSHGPQLAGRAGPVKYLV